MAPKNPSKNNYARAYFFLLTLDGEKMAAFTEIQLPEIEIELETVKEGGLNTYVHQLPGMRKASTIVLSHGIAKKDAFDKWVNDYLVQGKFKRKAVTLMLVDLSKTGIHTYYIQNSFPYKWSAAPLNSSSSTIAIQTLYLACGEITKD